MRALAPLPSHLPEVEQAARLPRGFAALGTTAGIKDSGAPDMGLVLVQELTDAGPTPEANPGAAGVGFTPHLVPMNRGILATGHVRPTRPVTNDELRELYEAAYADEYFVEVVGAPPATGHVRGSNFARVYVHYDERSGRITTVSVEDNLVKGAAGQAVQAFNIVFGLPESAGLEQLPIVP